MIYHTLSKYSEQALTNIIAQNKKPIQYADHNVDLIIIDYPRLIYFLNSGYSFTYTPFDIDILKVFYNWIIRSLSLTGHFQFENNHTCLEL